jgi:hypothetical protein
MKKYIFIFASVLICAGICAQNLQDFVQASAGNGVGGERGFIFQGEYGKTWKWLDVSLSMLYESPVSTAFAINAGINTVRIFTANSRHAFKIGYGAGYAFHQKINRFYTGSYYEMSVNNDRDFIFLPRLSYEFAITPKYTVGVFYQESYFLKSAGLSIRRNF